MHRFLSLYILFFFNDTATTEIYTLSLHDALPISSRPTTRSATPDPAPPTTEEPAANPQERETPSTTPRSLDSTPRSEEHTSELQSRLHLVCRLLLEKKKINVLKCDFYFFQNLRLY